MTADIKHLREKPFRPFFRIDCCCKIPYLLEWPAYQLQGKIDAEAKTLSMKVGGQQYTTLINPTGKVTERSGGNWQYGNPLKAFCLFFNRR